MRVGWPTVDEVWADLRATRSDPPGRAGAHHARRSVYLASLEQSEQLFKAAGDIGLASRPLLAFYGLSQAGRAVAAAAPSLDDNHWRLEGHGVSIRNEAAPLPYVAVAQQGRPESSFRRLSTLLDSPDLPDGKSSPFITLGELWDLLPEGGNRPLRSGHERRPAMYFGRTPLIPHPLASGVVCGFPRRLADSTQRAEDFKEFMSAYPHASGYSMVVTEPYTEIPDFVASMVPDGVDLRMHWDTGIRLATETQQDERLASVLTNYAGVPYLAPAVPGANRPLHPLMAWWGVLYLLSMLARYEPAAWTKHIDVNKSRYAVALEALLTDALIAVPRIIYHTIVEVSSVTGSDPARTTDDM